MIVLNNQKDVSEDSAFGSLSRGRGRGFRPKSISFTSRNSYGEFGTFSTAAVGSVSEKKKLLVSART